MAAAAPHVERVLVLLPTARDGERTRAALAREGLFCTVCKDMAGLCQEVAAGAGVALLTEETLVADPDGCLAKTLHGQPAWSDFPLVILAREGADGRPVAFRESLNVSLVERPVRIRSLLSVIRAALRERRHQYEVRDLLAERERQTNVLREKEERLQFALAAGRLGSWDLDLGSGQMEGSDLFKENFGWPPDHPVSYPDFLAAIYPEDRERVQATIRQSLDENRGFDAEFRVVLAGGAIRWILVRGRAAYGPDRSPLRISGVSLDMTERRRYEETLREADRKKDDFLALLAHELRNPLAPLSNGLQVLRMGRDLQLQERIQQMMERQLGHMVRLIDDLLDISRINRNKLELRMARVTLQEVVKNAVETTRPLIDAAGHELLVDLPDEPVLLNADLTRLAQVFANLLTNSVKYTASGGRITLSGRRVGDQVAVAVKDTGIGIPADFLTTIFDMFSQVDRSVERSTGGLGIGLALVKKLVDLHGGTVTAASEGPGRGSEFTVRLPAVRSPEEARPAPAAKASGDASGPRRRILVVDDNLDSADSMAEMLRLLGNEVAVAHDGLEAVERLGTFRPQLILMDIGMPHLNGLDATRRIREQPGGNEVTIVALTGWGQNSDRLRSKQAGCDGHLVKPVNFDDLRQLLSGLKAMPR